MGRKYKHRTPMFGESAEHYVASLFQLIRKPNGNQSPDLFDSFGRYTPHLIMEIKSGAKKKGVINDFQMHYGIQTAADYLGEFGEEPLKGLGHLDYSGRRVAVYYNVPDRVDGVRADELDRPFASVKLLFGDQFIVPSKFAFYQFAVCKAKRTHRSLDKVVEELKEVIKRDVVGRERGLHQNERKKDKNSWQNLQGRDVLAIFYDDLSLTSKPGKARVKRMREHYKELPSLDRIIIQGPKGSNIYILAEHQDFDLFNVQLRKVVEERTPILERVMAERKRAIKLLSKIVVSGNSISLSRRFRRNLLTEKQMARLDRLCKWESREDVFDGV